MAKYPQALGTVATAGTPVHPITTQTLCRNVLIQAPAANGAKKLLIKAADPVTGTVNANVIAEIAAGGGFSETSQSDANDIDASSYFIDADTNGATFYFSYTTN